MVDLEARLIDVTRERDFWENQARVAASVVTRLENALTAIRDYDCSPDTMGQCGCCSISKDTARDALEAM